MSLSVKYRLRKYLAVQLVAVGNRQPCKTHLNCLARGNINGQRLVDEDWICSAACVFVCVCVAFAQLTDSAVEHPSFAAAFHWGRGW